MKSWTLQVSMPPMNHLPEGLYTIYANLGAKLLVAVIKYLKFKFLAILSLVVTVCVWGGGFSPRLVYLLRELLL